MARNKPEGENTETTDQTGGQEHETRRDHHQCP